MKNDALHAMLYPRAVAVAGSASPGKLGAVLAERILDGGYEAVFCVNPKAAGVRGRTGYVSVCDIPAPVDLVVIASPAQTVPDVLRDAGKAGVRAAVIISSGFSEAGNAELENAVADAAREYGIRYVGPNCAGIVNTEIGLVATLEAAPSPGRVSLISQSGAIGGVFMSESKARGLGVAKFLSYGNGPDLNAVTLLSGLADDPGTDVIAMYVENVRDGRAFMDALSAATAKKPVVIIKSGRTSTGARAAQSHTGAMAGSDDAYDAAFRKCGALRVASVAEMVDACKALAAFPSAKGIGSRVAVVTNSGGPGVLTADRLAQLGLDAAAPGETLKAALRAVLPPLSGLSNPIDVTVEGTAEHYGAALDRLLPAFDAAVVIYVGTPYLAALPVAEAVANASTKHGKPVLAQFAVGSDIDLALAALETANVPCFPSGECAAVGLSALCHDTGVRGLLRADVPAKPLGKDFILEPDAMEILDHLGISTPPHGVAHTSVEAASIAKGLGFPVCMKIVSRDILHKSDVGGVKLNIRDESEAEAAFAALRAVCDGHDFSGAIVYPMLAKGVEVIMGLVRDATFGPVAVFGLGGVFTETMRDISLMVAPLSHDEALAMIRSVKAYKLLSGARGAKPCDVGALADMLAKLSLLMFRHEEIAEVDLNPVFAYEQGAVVADARMILR